MPTAEPSLATLPNPALRLLAATRPAFLSVSLVAVLLGLAIALAFGASPASGPVLLAMLLALIAHAGVNVLNDYYDALSGTDAANTERIFPFTGGSRFIQNDVLSLEDTRRLGLALFGVVLLGGLGLMAAVGPQLLAFGLGGLFIGWAYSAPPLALDSRGLGQLCVTAGFVLMIWGMERVADGPGGPVAVLLGLPYAILVANILFINQFPDRRADLACGKRTLVTRLAPDTAVTGYLLLVLFAHGWLAALLLLGLLPLSAVLALLPSLFLGLRSWWLLRRHHAQPSRLAPALQSTIAAAISHGLLLALTLWWTTL